MRVPLEWLKEYVAVRLKPEPLAERLTMAGLEVTGIERVEGQAVLNLEITPNRADCLSIIGIAREVAAITGQRLKLPQGEGSRVKGQGVHPSPATLHRNQLLSIRILDRKGCRRYIGRLFGGVTIGPSPEWMQRRLAACGLRPINTVVDITNYVLLEYGQPLHAFDYDTVAESTIVVRRATPNERITTLDGIARTLSPAMLVIADARRPVAVAGVMGGLGSEVSSKTTRVLLESAWFDPILVRRTARALGLTSESSYRFERGVDPEGVEAASARAAALLGAHAAGRDVAVCDVGAKPSTRTTILLETDRTTRWLGLLVPSATMRTTLARLSCHVASSGDGKVLRVRVPSFRQDLQQEVDLYEELARIIGYDQVPSRLPSCPMARGRSEDAARYESVQSVRCLCASLGLVETVNWALVAEADLARSGYAPEHAIRLTNPLSHDHAYLRPSLLIGLLATVRRNLTQGAMSVRLFEVGNVFRRPSADSSTTRVSGEWREEPFVGIALSGVWSRTWRAKDPCDFFRLKGILEAFTSQLCEGRFQISAAQFPWAEPGQGVAVSLAGHAVGVAGRVARAIAKTLDIDQEVWVAELSLEGLLANRKRPASFHSLSVFPPVKRDLSILVNDEVPCESIDQAIRDVGGALAGHVELIDRYTGTQVPSGTHSLTFSIEYRDPSRTLTAVEADALHQKIGHVLIQRFGAQLR